jgi:hypothetical protein
VRRLVRLAVRDGRARLGGGHRLVLLLLLLLLFLVVLVLLLVHAGEQLPPAGEEHGRLAGMAHAERLAQRQVQL